MQAANQQQRRTYLRRRRGTAFLVARLWGVVLPGPAPFGCIVFTRRMLPSAFAGRLGAFLRVGRTAAAPAPAPAPAPPPAPVAATLSPAATPLPVSPESPAAAPAAEPPSLVASSSDEDESVPLPSDAPAEAGFAFCTQHNTHAGSAGAGGGAGKSARGLRAHLCVRCLGKLHHSLQALCEDPNSARMSQNCQRQLVGTQRAAASRTLTRASSAFKCTEGRLNPEVEPGAA